MDKQTAVLRRRSSHGSITCSGWMTGSGSRSQTSVVQEAEDASLRTTVLSHGFVLPADSLGCRVHGSNLTPLLHRLWKREKKTLSKHFNYLLLLLSKNSFITAKGNMTETGGLEHENRIWALAPSSVLFRKLQVRKRLIFTWLYRLYCRLKKVTCSKHTNIKSRVLTRHVFSYFWDNVELIFWLTLQPNVDIRQSNL